MAGLLSANSPKSSLELLAARRGDDRPLYQIVRGNEMIEAVCEGDIEKVREWLELGVDPDSPHIAVCPYGTALSNAAFLGDVEMAQLLIRYGADVNLRSRTRTPLELAVLGNHPEMIKLLIAAGAR